MIRIAMKAYQREMYRSATLTVSKSPDVGLRRTVSLSSTKASLVAFFGGEEANVGMNMEFNTLLQFVDHVITIGH